MAIDRDVFDKLNQYTLNEKNYIIYHNLGKVVTFKD